ncbi:MAG: hypothetical protein P8Y45_22555 [Exilibacterium sp.]
MTTSIAINNLPEIAELSPSKLGSVWGRGVANSFLFRSTPRAPRPQTIMNFNIDTFEVNNFDITNNIDKLIKQTNNQLQLSQINVEAGDGATIDIFSNQGLSGANSSNVA